MNALSILSILTTIAAVRFAFVSKGSRRLTAGFVALIAGGISILGITDATAGSAIKPPMVGTWNGESRIIVDWCKQEKLPISLKIAADGSVTGKIGDATLTDGKLRRNRGTIGRWLKLKTDFILTGNLKGAIVKAEGITRSGVSLPLNFDGKNFTGGLHTTGKKIGDKQSMKLSATGLALKLAAK